MKNTCKNILKLVLIILIIIGIYYYDNNNNKEVTNTQNKINTTDKVEIDNNLLNIYYLDVGEGDSTLIKYKDYNVLIDGGNTVDGKNIVSFLKELGVDHIDYLIATHAHEDHIGGLNFVIYKIPINKFYMPDHKADWKSYDNVLNASKEKNIEIEQPVIDTKFNLEDLYFTILWIDNQEDYNENSIVLKLNYKNTSYLFMADATEEVEHNILEKDLNSDVLKVGHHGSKHSSSANFLVKVNPKYAIISCGKDNDYGHPHQVVLDKLEKMNTEIYRTDINKTIHLTSNGNSINIESINKSLNGGDLG